MKTTKINGLIAAPFTPFTAKGEVNFEAIDRQAADLIRSGVVGAYVCGTTGEGILCTMDEREKILERWLQAAQGKLRIIVHTGAYAFKDMERLSRHAVDCKVDGFSVIPHGFFKPGKVEQLVDYCAKAAAMAPELPFYYYNTMSAGLNFPMSRFLELASVAIPNLGGIKYYSYDLFEYQKCLNFEEGKYDIVYGADELFPAALACGAKGFIGSTYNYMPELYQDIRKAFEANEMEKVRQEMRKVLAIVDLLIQYGGIGVGKTLMQLRGIDCGDTRAPLGVISKELQHKIVDKAKKILGC